MTGSSRIWRPKSRAVTSGKMTDLHSIDLHDVTYLVLITNMNVDDDYLGKESVSPDHTRA